MKNTGFSNSITEGVIWEQLLIFFFPILLGSFFQQLYNTVDTLIVGRYVGDIALAAVGGATSVFINLLVGFFTGLASGVTVVISQYYGASDLSGLSKALHTGAALSLVSGIIITAVGLGVSPLVLRAMNTPPEVLPLANEYLLIYFAGSMAVVIYNIGSGVLRALGNSRLPLLFLIICTLINIVLDLVFVINFKMGVRGVAIATIIAELVSAVLIIISLCKINPVYGLKVREIRFHLDILKRIFHVGVPGGLQSVMYSLSNLFIQAGINGFGAATMAMWTAYGKIDAMYWMIISAFGISITTFVGQNFGAKNYDRIKKSVKTCLIMSSGATIILVALLIAFAEPLFGVFSQNPEIIKSGSYCLRIIVPFYLAYLFIEVFSGAMRGVGDSIVPLIITMVGICLIRFAWSLFVVPMTDTFLHVVFVFPITWFVTAVAFIIYYLRGSWLKKHI